MSQGSTMVQAEGSIVEIANTVFGRNKFEAWKVFEPNQPYLCEHFASIFQH